jgi:hypothetical protein
MMNAGAWGWEFVLGLDVNGAWRRRFQLPQAVSNEEWQWLQK